MARSVVFDPVCLSNLCVSTLSTKRYLSPRRVRREGFIPHLPDTILTNALATAFALCPLPHHRLRLYPSWITPTTTPPSSPPSLPKNSRPISPLWRPCRPMKRLVDSPWRTAGVWLSQVPWPTPRPSSWLRPPTVRIANLPFLQFASDAWFPESVAPATPYQNQVPFTPYQNQVPPNPYQNQVLATQYQHQATQYQSQATLYQNQVGDYAQQVYASQYWQQPLVQSMFAGPSNLDGSSYTFANSLAPEAPAALPPSTSSKHRFRSPTS